ncbi:calmodulin-binding protein 60 D-like isoform X2 [Mercurialis annua]|nr:calmodulin-binding protein 60 D-like isoform X2 [Mercurialis annua]
MFAKMWDVTVEHARTCVLDKRLYLHFAPSSQQKSGVVFNVVGQLTGLLSDCQYVPIDKLAEPEKVGLLGMGRTFQRDLNRIAEVADTSSSEGLIYVLTANALVRNDTALDVARIKEHTTVVRAIELSFRMWTDQIQETINCKKHGDAAF